jgi:hypothetical protein
VTGNEFEARGGGGRLEDIGGFSSLMGEEIMEDTDCDDECPLTSLDARLAFGGGRGAAR